MRASILSTDRQPLGQDAAGSKRERSMSNRYNRRQRKKLRRDEFQELGFHLSAQWVGGLDRDTKVAACDAFISECIEGNRLSYGGAIDNGLDGFAVPEGNRSSATEEHRRLVMNWLESRTEFTAVRIGSLVDAWHGNHEG